MSTKTKHRKCGIAALCGAAVLFIGEMEPMVSFAEQTEMDLSSVQEEAVPDSIPQDTLETQSPEMKNTTESFTEEAEMTSESSTEDAQTPQETGSETMQTDSGTEGQPAQSESHTESEAPSSEKPAESETGQTEKPVDTEAGPPQETAPSQTEPGTVPETTGKEPETSESTSTETKQIEISSEISGIGTGISEEGETEYFFPYYDETETEIIGIDTSMYEQDSYDDGSGGYGSYGGSTYWDPSWYITSKYRFRQIDKVILTSGGESVDVMEDMKADADRVGRIPQFGVAYLLQEEDGGWLYIESGEVRGFVQASSLKKEDGDGGLAGIVGDDNLAKAKALCEKSDNDAYTHTLTTVQDVTTEKEYAVLIRPEEIHEYADEKSRVVGKGQSGALVCVLKTTEDGWDFVESGNVRGFIPPQNLVAGENAEKMVESTGETTFFGITQELDPEENRSFYYTLASTQTAADELGQEIADYAASYVGRLGYVWGGNDLSSGTDCSGFVQAVFASYGINLPRLAQEIGSCGQEIRSLEEARAGDVVYWGGGPHVGIYLGDGKVVECHGNESNTADNPGQGPTIQAASYMEITSIRRFLIEAPDMQGAGGNRTDPTPYSQKQLELIWAIVAQEDNGSYEGALAVISSAMNRTESPKWGYEGGNALSQLTAAGQYCYSIDSYWIPRLDGNVPDYVKQAVYDCLNKGIRNHAYTSFRSTRRKTAGADAVQVGGNWYFDS